MLSNFNFMLICQSASLDMKTGSVSIREIVSELSIAAGFPIQLQVVVGCTLPRSTVLRESRLFLLRRYWIGDGLWETDGEETDLPMAQFEHLRVVPFGLVMCFDKPGVHSFELIDREGCLGEPKVLSSYQIQVTLSS